MILQIQKNSKKNLWQSIENVTAETNELWSQSHVVQEKKCFKGNN